MENAETILVIILAAFLAIFLLLAIVLLIKCLQVATSVKRITDKAEHLVDQAESVSEFFKAASGSFAVGKIISRLAQAVTSRETKRSKRGK